MLDKAYNESLLEFKKSTPTAKCEEVIQLAYEGMEILRMLEEDQFEQVYTMFPDWFGKLQGILSFGRGGLASNGLISGMMRIHYAETEVQKYPEYNVPPGVKVKLIEMMTIKKLQNHNNAIHLEQWFNKCVYLCRAIVDHFKKTEVKTEDVYVSLLRYLSKFISVGVYAQARLDYLKNEGRI